MKTINEQEFQALNIELTEFNKKQIESVQRFKKEVEQFYPCEVRYFISGEINRFEWCYVYMNANDLLFRIYQYKNKYHIYCENKHSIRNLSNSQISEVTRKFESPNQIGVFTTKKIQAWIDYETATYNALLENEQQNKSAEQEFLKSIENLPVRFDRDDKTKGSIKINGIEFSFEIIDGHVYQKIKLNYSAPTSLELFLKLADNQNIEK